MTEDRTCLVMTVEGNLIDVLDPNPDHVTIEVIAHHLSMQCRYNGACRRFYSVAQHSVICASVAMTEYGDEQLARTMLLHDAHEAFIGDIISPIKPTLDATLWSHASDALDLVIQRKFNVYFDDERIDLIDKHVLALEWNALMPEPNRYDDLKITDRSSRIKPQSQSVAYLNFLHKSHARGIYDF